MPDRPNQEQIQNTSIDSSKQKASYQGIIETGYAIGIGKYGMNNFRLNFINSLSRNQYFSAGIGIGLRWQNEEKFYETGKWPTFGSERMYPLFLDLRTTFRNNKLLPFFAVGIGGYFGVYGMWSGIKGGFLINPSFGIKIKISDKSAIIGSVDYEYLDMPFYDVTSYPCRESVGSFGINIGINFKSNPK